MEEKVALVEEATIEEPLVETVVEEPLVEPEPEVEEEKPEKLNLKQCLKYSCC